MISTLRERYTIKLIFISYLKEKEKRFITKFKLSFQNESQNIKTDEIEFDIPKELFKYKRDKIVISVDLYENNLLSQKNQSYNFKFNAYKGENKAYVFIDAWNCKVFEVIFKNLEGLNMKYTQLDTLDNKYRKRLTLINSGNTNFQINNKIYDLTKIIYNNYEINENLPESYQISVEDFSERIFIIKPLSEPKELDLTFIKDNNENFKNIMSNLEKVLADECNYSQNYYNFRANYLTKAEQKYPKLNKESEYLNELYNKYGIDLELFYNYFFIYFFLNKKENFEFEFIKHLVSYLKARKNELEINNKILLDEKIRILSSYFHILNDCEKKEDLNIPIKHFILSERKPNSILDRVYRFYNNFINELTEEDEIFFYLLQVDSGFGFFKKNKVYSFDITNIQMMKKHLKELLPKSLTFYNCDNDGIAFTSSITEAIIINEKYILFDTKNDIDYNSDNPGLSNEQMDEIAMNITLLLFHEFLGHKKFSNSQNPGSSPKKIIKNKKIIELKHKNESYKNEQNCEYILTTHSNPNKGDSGHFLELCYGKFNNQLILNLLFYLKNKGKIIKRIDLFFKSKETLSKYVSLRVIAEEKGYEFNFNNSQAIEEEIAIMEKKINIEEYIKEKNQKKMKNDNNNKQFIGKKKSRTLDDNKDEYFGNNFIKSQGEYEKLNEDEENSEISDEKSNVKKLNKIELLIKKDRKIIKRLGFKNDDNLLENIENKFNENNLSEQDLKDLNYLYSKFLINY